jgi:hypothetical protein
MMTETPQMAPRWEQGSSPTEVSKWQWSGSLGLLACRSGCTLLNLNVYSSAAMRRGYRLGLAKSLDRPCVWVVYIDERAALTADIDEAEVVVNPACVVRVGPEAHSDCGADENQAPTVDPCDLGLNRAREILIDEVGLTYLCPTSNYGVALIGMSCRSTAKISRDHAKVINPQLLIESRIIGVDDILEFKMNYADIGGSLFLGQ